MFLAAVSKRDGSSKITDIGDSKWFEITDILEAYAGDAEEAFKAELEKVLNTPRGKKAETKNWLSRLDSIGASSVEEFSAAAEKESQAGKIYMAKNPNLSPENAEWIKNSGDSLLKFGLKQNPKYGNKA